MDRILGRFDQQGLLFLRVAISITMLTHGVPKLMQLFSGGEIQFPDPLGVGVTLSLALAVFSEFACSILILIGYKVRLATIPLIVTMIVAAFIIHGADPWARQEKAVMYLIVYVALLFMGGGKYSIDAKINTRRKA